MLDGVLATRPDSQSGCGPTCGRPNDACAHGPSGPDEEKAQRSSAYRRTFGNRQNGFQVVEDELEARIVQAPNRAAAFECWVFHSDVIGCPTLIIPCFAICTSIQKSLNNVGKWTEFGGLVKRCSTAPIARA